MNNNYLIVMAGGVGTRFWPMSRVQKPKQFLDILGTGQSLLQQSVERFEGIVPHQNIFVVTSQEYTQLVQEQLPFLEAHQILAEPSRKNTAPCIAYACYKIAKINPLASVVVTPADHIVLKQELFKEKINTCLEAAQLGENIVTLGIQPTRPDTGYGYIKFQKTADNQQFNKVLQFTEKPNLTTAQAFVNSGEYLWNAGIFIWKVSTFCKKFGEYMPQMASDFAGGESHYFTDNEIDFIENLYQNCQNISIDYALMEKADTVQVVLADVGWSDLGTWRSLHDAAQKDENHNHITGNVFASNTINSIINTPEALLVIAHGLDGYIVSEHNGALLICKIEDEQKVKEFVEIAKNSNKD